MRTNDKAGAEVVGALLLFGIFVGTIAFLNVTAVPQAGLANEEGHFLDTVAALNALQASAEAAALPGGAGTTVSQAVVLGPPQGEGSDFFSFFVATPAKASGELLHNTSYGSVTLSHREAGTSGAIYDVGSASTELPLGAIVFDPNGIFRGEGVVSIENGALITTEGTSQTLRYAPPISASSSDGITHVTIKTRILNGTSTSLGGTGPARLSLTTEATTLNAPDEANAQEVTLRLETAYGSAWGSYLNETASSGGLETGEFTTLVSQGTGTDGLDVVTWTVTGPPGTGNDIRLTTGLAILGVELS